MSQQIARERIRELEWSERLLRLAMILTALAMAFASGFVIVRVPNRLPFILGGIIALAIGLRLFTLSAKHRGAVVLAIAGFLLMGYPTARIVIATMPLYFIDVFVALAVLSALVLKKLDWSRWQPLPQLIIVYMLLTAVSSLYGIWLTGAILHSLYLLIRHILSMAWALVIPILIQTERDLRHLLWSLVLGLLLTATVTLAVAVPIPNNPVRNIFPHLRPQKIYYAESLTQYERALRGESLRGGATTTAAAIVIIWPIVLSMYLSDQFRRHRRFLLLTLIVGIAGLAMTYTRAGYLSLGLILIASLVIMRDRGRWRITWVLVGLLLLVLVFTVGQSRGFFRFDWIADKFAALVEDPGQRHGDEARIAAYRNILPFLLKHPLWLVTGRGLAWFKLYSYNRIDWFAWSDIVATENHSAWALVFYERGLLAAGLLTLAVFVAIRQLQQSSTAATEERFFGSWLSRGLLVAGVGLSPIWLLYQFFGTLGGEPFLFLYFGLAMVLYRYSVPSKALAQHSELKENKWK